MKRVARRDNSDIQMMIIYDNLCSITDCSDFFVPTFYCDHILNKFIAIVHLHLMLFLDAMHRDGQLFTEVVLTYVCQGYS